MSLDPETLRWSAHQMMGWRKYFSKQRSDYPAVQNIYSHKATLCNQFYMMFQREAHKVEKEGRR